MPFYPELTGARYLRFLSSLGDSRPAPARLEFLLRRFDVSDLDLKRRMRDYSHGMKRKLGIVQALMTDAPVLILDEPTSGLDPLMIEAFAETVDELARSGTHDRVPLVAHPVGGRSHLPADRARARRPAGRRSHAQRAARRRAATDDRDCSRRRSTATCRPCRARRSSRASRRDGCVDVQGPLGEIIPRLGHLPVADVQLAAFTLDEAILRLLSVDPPSDGVDVTGTLTPRSAIVRAREDPVRVAGPGADRAAAGDHRGGRDRS